jgi:hypothetical protein
LFGLLRSEFFPGFGTMFSKQLFYPVVFRPVQWRFIVAGQINIGARCDQDFDDIQVGVLRFRLSNHFFIARSAAASFSTFAIAAASSFFVSVSSVIFSSAAIFLLLALLRFPAIFR